MSTEQGELAGFKPNPKRYAQLSQPFASKDELDAAFMAFHEKLSALRVECGVADLVFAISGKFLEADGEIGEAGTSGGFGDLGKHEGMAAYLYGRMAAERESMVLGLVKTGRKQR